MSVCMYVYESVYMNQLNPIKKKRLLNINKQKTLQYKYTQHTHIHSLSHTHTYTHTHGGHELKKAELRYLLGSFRNAPDNIKKNLWWTLIHDWLLQVAEEKWHKGEWDYEEKSNIQSYAEYRDTVEEILMESWR